MAFDWNRLWLLLLIVRVTTAATVTVVRIYIISNVYVCVGMRLGCEYFNNNHFLYFQISDTRLDFFAF